MRRHSITPTPFFRYYGAPRSYRDILAAGLLGQLDRDPGAVAALEQELARFTGSPNALFLPQARLGLYLALRSAITPARPRVVLSPYTIWDVVNMVLCAGGTPVFADVEAETGNLDADAVAEALDDATGALLVTHLNGLACEIERFRALCEERGIPLLEDAAQAFGARVNGRRVGTFGRFGVFSFSVKKHVNCLYGGALVGDDAVRVAEARGFLAALPPESPGRLLRRAAETLGSRIASSAPLFAALTFPLLRRRVERGGETALPAVRYEHAPERRAALPDRYLRRPTSCQARLVADQLPDCDRLTERRIAYAREYHARLGGLPGLRLPPLREDGAHVYLSFPVQVRDRLAFQRGMLAAGCDVKLQSFLNLADADCYAEFRRDCPRAREVAARSVLLPICPDTGTEEIRRVADAARALLLRGAA